MKPLILTIIISPLFILSKTAEPCEYESERASILGQSIINEKGFVDMTPFEREWRYGEIADDKCRSLRWVRGKGRSLLDKCVNIEMPKIRKYWEERISEFKSFIDQGCLKHNEREKRKRDKSEDNLLKCKIEGKPVCKLYKQQTKNSGGGPITVTYKEICSPECNNLYKPQYRYCHTEAWKKCKAARLKTKTTTYSDLSKAKADLSKAHANIKKYCN